MLVFNADNRFGSWSLVRRSSCPKHQLFESSVAPVPPGFQVKGWKESVGIVNRMADVKQHVAPVPSSFQVKGWKESVGIVN
jgi:hypothetical protein